LKHILNITTSININNNGKQYPKANSGPLSQKSDSPD